MCQTTRTPVTAVCCVYVVCVGALGLTDSTIVNSTKKDSGSEANSRTSEPKATKKAMAMVKVKTRVTTRYRMTRMSIQVFTTATTMGPQNGRMRRNLMTLQTNTNTGTMSRSARLSVAKAHQPGWGADAVWVVTWLP